MDNGKCIRQYYCFKCEGIVNPLRLGGATFQCSKCGVDMTLSVVSQYEAIIEERSDCLEK